MDWPCLTNCLAASSLAKVMKAKVFGSLFFILSTGLTTSTTLPNCSKCACRSSLERASPGGSLPTYTLPWRASAFLQVTCDLKLQKASPNKVFHLLALDNMGSLCKSGLNPRQLLEHNEGKPSGPASHWVHLEVDVFDVTKGPKVLLDVGVLGLLKMDIVVTSSASQRRNLFQATLYFVITLYRRPNTDI